jgi:dolichol-phosphate mannosyltransferase
MAAGRFVIALPTYNERDNLPRVVDALAVQRTRTAVPGDVLVVDDRSPDGTGAIAEALAAELPEVCVLHRDGPRGLGAAYLAGFDVALAGGAAYVVEMDCDLSHDPEDLPRLLAVVREGGADLALGSRYVPGGGLRDWGPVRRLVSRGGSWYARAVLGVGVRDLTGGFKCFRRGVLEAIDLPTIRSRGYAFQVELTYRTLVAGFAVREVPIVFRDRRLGRSKMSWRIALEALVLVPRLRRQARHVAGGAGRAAVTVAGAASSA